MARRGKQPKQIASLSHREARRTNIPTAEYQSVMEKAQQAPVKVSYPRGANGLGAEKERRNRDLDPQLVWRGKDQQDWSDPGSEAGASLVVNAPPLYIQEKVSPKVLIDDLLRETKGRPRGRGAGAGLPSSPGRGAGAGLPSPSGRGVGGEGSGPRDADRYEQPDLFGDFNGLPEGADKTDFYHYEGNWQNRMILGDSLQVMASLAEREGLRGKVQCIYLDPPYGIKFNSNFQWSTTSRDVKDGNAEHITREPEQVKAFRDTWRDGIHSYLTYLRDRLTVARDLLTESGSIFVQIGDENVHRVRVVMDEVFGDENFISLISHVTTGGVKQNFLATQTDYVIWYGKQKPSTKYRQLFKGKDAFDGSSKTFTWLELSDGSRRGMTSEEQSTGGIPSDALIYRPGNVTTQGNPVFEFRYRGKRYARPWKTTAAGMTRMGKATRLHVAANSLSQMNYLDDYPVSPVSALWTDTFLGSFAEDKVYVVQTSRKVIERCVLMSTDPGDLVLDPTCGSGTTAYVAEQWGRRWITIDTSRVALALARARIMGARYPYYLLADSKEGQLKEAEVTRSVPKTSPTYGNIGLGFVYERVPHITLKSIANNTEIDVIWDKYERELAPLRKRLTDALPAGWLGAYRKQQQYTAEVPAEIQEWEVPREISPFTDAAANNTSRHSRESGNPVKKDWTPASAGVTSKSKCAASSPAGEMSKAKGAAAGATEPASELETLLAQFWKLRIARQKEIDASIAAKADFENLYDKPYEDKKKVRVAGPFTVESLSPHRILGVDEHGEVIDGVQDAGDARDFAGMILENLKTAGVQQAHKDGRIAFTSLAPWPGELVCAEGRYLEGTTERRAAIFIGPEFGTVSRTDLVAAAREAGDADFDVLIACAFAYEAHATEFEKLGRIPVLKARMNADLHMADDLKNTGKGNLFVIFGEPDLGIFEGGSAELRSELAEQQAFVAGFPALEASLKGSGDSDRSGQLEKARWRKQRALRFIEMAPTVPDGMIVVEVRGVDVFKPQTGKVDSDGPDEIACWFVDTDYNEESFFVRQAYFLGANDPYKSLKTTLKAEIDRDAWETLHSAVSRPFPKPATGRIAVKVINHLGDEVMKVFRVG